MAVGEVFRHRSCNRKKVLGGEFENSAGPQAELDELPVADGVSVEEHEHGAEAGVGTGGLH